MGLVSITIFSSLILLILFVYPISQFNCLISLLILIYGINKAYLLLQFILAYNDISILFSYSPRLLGIVYGLCRRQYQPIPLGRPTSQLRMLYLPRVLTTDWLYPPTPISLAPPTPSGCAIPMGLQVIRTYLEPRAPSKGSCTPEVNEPSFIPP